MVVSLPGNPDIRGAMIALPHAKINLGLQVLRLRPDGYRDIRTIMVPVPLRDALEAVVDPDLAPGDVVMTRSGRPVPGDTDQDLCMKAVRALAQHRELPGIRLHLHKVTPLGAGLGGGSSDGAHTLLLLNELLGLGHDHRALHSMASGLGSDCAFFLRPEVQLAEGRGEVLTPVPLQLAGWWIALVNPGIHVATAEVYANTPVHPASDDLVAIVQEHPGTWAGRLVNAMEPYVFKAYPEVAAMKDALQNAGATYAAMSGSGATVFGLFKERPDLSLLGDKLILLDRFNGPGR